MAIQLDDFGKKFFEVVERKKGNKDVRCPICTDNHWEFPGVYHMSILQDEPTGIRFGGSAIPTLPVICANCGFVAHFAAGKLGLLPAIEPTTEGQKS